MIDIELPWGAWFQERRRRLHLPAAWRVDMLDPEAAASLSPVEIARRIDAPLEGPPLSELARGCASACIAVDDLARPTRAADILPAVLERLEQSGLERDVTRIVVATGSHSALDRAALEWKLGRRIAAEYQVESHDCRGDLADTGILFGEQPVRLNRTFLDAELKIAIGAVLPHSFAAYSGGAKMVLPGLSDLATTVRSHKFVQLGLWRSTDPDENRFRREAETIARRVGLSFVIAVVCGPGRATADLYAGDLVAAHRAACAAAQTQYRAVIQHDYDCAVLNAYPKDNDLLQADNVFVALKTAKRPIVRDGGVLVLATAASQGLGRHGLFEPGGASYRTPVKKRTLGDRDLWLFVPDMPADQVRAVYWDGYRVFHDEVELARALAERLPGPRRAVVFPCAPMQQIDDQRPLPLEATA